MTLTLQARSATLPLGSAAAEMGTDGGYRPRERADAYTRVLDGARCGDHTGFVRADVVEQAWRIVGALLDRSTAPTLYPKGSWGPTAAGV